MECGEPSGKDHLLKLFHSANKEKNEVYTSPGLANFNMLPANTCEK